MTLNILMYKLRIYVLSLTFIANIYTSTVQNISIGGEYFQTPEVNLAADFQIRTGGYWLMTEPIRIVRIRGAFMAVLCVNKVLIAGCSHSKCETRCGPFSVTGNFVCRTWRAQPDVECGKREGGN